MADLRSRHGCLTTWLVFMIVANSASALMYLLGSFPLPNIPGWASPVLFVLSGFNLVCAIALFQWKKDAFWGFCASSVVTLLVILSLGLGMGRVLSVLVGVLLLYSTLYIRKGNKVLPQLEYFNMSQSTEGTVLEQMILPALVRGGYQYQTQVNIGVPFGDGRQVISAVAENPQGHRYLISLKCQQVSGTAEQVVRFEAMCLAEAIRSGECNKAYLVLGGEGWKLRTFYTGGGLKEHLRFSDLVDIVTLEEFVSMANQGTL